MRIPLKRETAGKIELALVRFARSWEGLDPLRRATAIKAVMLSEMLGGRAKAAAVSVNPRAQRRRGACARVGAAAEVFEQGATAMRDACRAWGRAPSAGRGP